MNREPQAGGRAPEFLLASILIFAVLAFGATETWSLASLEILSFLLFLISLFRYRYMPRNIALNTLLPAACAMLMLGLIQWMNPTRITFPATWNPSTASAFATGNELCLCAAAIAIAISAAFVFENSGAVTRMAWVLFILGVLVSFVGIVQRGQGNLAYYGLRAVRTGHPFGPYANYNHGGNLVAMSFYCGMGIFLSRLVHWPRGAGIGPLADFISQETLLVFLLVLTSAGLIATTSRGALDSALLAGILFLALTAWQFSQHRGLLAGASLACMLFFVGFLARYPQFAGNFFDHPDFSTATRLSIYRSSFRMLADFPVWGVGLGAFMSAFPPYHEYWKDMYTVDHAHCDYLEFAVTCGIPAATLLALSLLTYARQASRIISGIREPGERLLRAGVAAACATFLLHSFVDFSAHIPANLFCFITLMALLGSSANRATERRAIPTWIRISLALSAVLLMIPPALALAAEHLRLKAELSPLEVRPYYLSQALKFQANPRLFYRLGYTEMEIATKYPAAELVMLRNALGASGSFYRHDPVDTEGRRLEGKLLWRLGRQADAVSIAR